MLRHIKAGTSARYHPPATSTPPTFGAAGTPSTVSSGSSIIGDATILATSDGGINDIKANKVTLPYAGTPASLSIYFTSAAGLCRMGIYDDTGVGGLPGQLVAVTAEFAPAIGWQTVATVAPTLLAAGNYWLAFILNDVGTNARAAATGPGFSDKTFTYAALPSTYGTPTSSGTNFHWSLYATFSTSVVGDATILATSDGGINDIKANKVTLANPGVPASLSIYFSSAAGLCRMGIYDDTGAGGLPGQLMAVTAEFAPAIGWQTVSTVSPTMLAAGNYWLAFILNNTGTNARATTTGPGFSDKTFTYAALPSTYGTPTSSGTNFHWSLYATFSVLTTHTVPVPAGMAANEVSVVFIQAEKGGGQALPGIPTGFAQAPSSPVVMSGASANDLHVLWKRQTAATGAGETTGSYTFVLPAGVTNLGAFAARIHGVVASGTAFDVTTSAVDPNASDTNCPAVSLTTTGANRLLVWAATATLYVAYDTLSGFTENIASAGAAGTLSFSMETKSQAVAGSTGSLTGTTAAGLARNSVWFGSLVPVGSASPTITSIVPNPGPAGVVTINGTNFIAGATVSFGGNAGTGITIVSSTQITCTAPAHADGAVTTTVTTSVGTSAGVTFTYQAAVVSSANLTQTTVDLVWAPPDAVVTEVGRDGSDSFGNTGGWSGVPPGPSPLTFVNLIPATTYVLYVIIGGVTYPTTITTLGATLPTISSITPNPAPAGPVTINGTNFIAGATVSFGGSAGTGVTVVSGTQITCTAPAHADGSVSTTVTTSAGTSGGVSFTYQATATPTGNLPFNLPNVSASPKKALAHYFYMPISMLGNESPASDYYTNGFINPNGEGGGHLASGGWFRNRPWPRAPLPGDFRLTDCDTDIRRARSCGLDGFFCNIMWSDWNGAMAVRAAYTQKLIPAAASYPGFLCVAMIDTLTVGAADVNLMAQQLQLYYGKPSTWMDGGAMIVSNFNCEGNSTAWWNSLYTACQNLGFTVKFIDIFQNQSLAPTYAASGHQFGAGIFGPGASANGVIGSSQPSPASVRARGEKFLSPIWIQDNRPREGYYNESLNTLALTNFWQEAINVNADFCQLCTWSDYTEGSTFNATPAQGLVALDISAYYMAWWKTGSAPTIVRDCIYLSYRNHVTNAPVLGPQTYFMVQHLTGTPFRNSVEVLSFLTAPANVTVTINGVTTTFTNVAAGVQRNTVPITAAGNVSAAVIRAGATIASVAPLVPIRSTMWAEDYGYYMFGSLRGTNANAAMATDASRQFDPSMTSSGANPVYPV